MLRTKAFLSGIIRLRQSLMLPVLPMLFLVTKQKFWELSAILDKGLVLSRLRLVIPVTLCSLAFFYFLIQLGYFSQIPVLLFE